MKWRFMKFMHTADWQIGMTFHGHKEKSRIMMEDDRLEVIEAIGEYANKTSNGIDFVLVCGDMFETPRVSETLVKKTFKKIERINKPVFVLAGNHEWNGSEYMFSTKYFLENKPKNLHVLTAGINAVDGHSGVEIVAAPLQGKVDEIDLVKAQLDLLEPTNNIRIMAGHGSIDLIMPAGARKDLIAIAPIEKALAEKKISYVAMGDRHSTTKVGDTGLVWYSGAPEPTSFAEDDQRNVLVVEIKPGEKAEVEKVEVGQWDFIRLGTKFEQYQLRTKQDLNDLEKFVDKVRRPSKTAIKIYLDSVLDFDTDVRRGNLFDEWEDELLARFEVSKSSTGARIESDPINEKAPAGLSGYALSAYEELKELATSDDDEADIALEALKLLTEFAGGNK
jgi:DNA repair exonuclease SbcCD nuclease subunit